MNKELFPNNTEVLESINELKSLIDKQSILTIDKMEWWLLKYNDYYKGTHYYMYGSNRFTTEIEDGFILRIPPLNEKIRKELLDVYKGLEEISKWHKFENHFKKVLINYKEISNSINEVKKWVVKNESIGNDLSNTFGGTLDIEDSDNKLILYSPIYPAKLRIYTPREEFKYTIEFYIVFNELFWEKVVYPESEILRNLENS